MRAEGERFHRARGEGEVRWYECDGQFCCSPDITAARAAAGTRLDWTFCDPPSLGAARMAPMRQRTGRRAPSCDPALHGSAERGSENGEHLRTPGAAYRRDELWLLMKTDIFLFCRGIASQEICALWQWRPSAAGWSGWRFAPAERRIWRNFIARAVVEEPRVVDILRQSACMLPEGSTAGGVCNTSCASSSPRHAEELSA